MLASRPSTTTGVTNPATARAAPAAAVAAIPTTASEVSSTLATAPVSQGKGSVEVLTYHDCTETAPETMPLDATFQHPPTTGLNNRVLRSDAADPPTGVAVNSGEAEAGDVRK